MFKIIGISTLLVLACGSQAFAQTEEPNPQVQVTLQELNRVEVRVDGLSCPFCAYGLEKKLLKIDGMKDLEIDIDKGLVTFSLKKGKSVDEKSIRKIVKDAGFTPKEIRFSKNPK